MDAVGLEDVHLGPFDRHVVPEHADVRAALHGADDVAQLVDLRRAAHPEHVAPGIERQLHESASPKWMPLFKRL